MTNDFELTGPNLYTEYLYVYDDILAIPFPCK